MNWRRWTERQIRKYLSSELLREDILEELKAIEQNHFYLSTSTITDTPLQPSNFHKSSIVEKGMLFREVSRDFFSSRVK